VNFDPIWSHPKPVQKPWPPITMGASTPYGRERVARFCDGWLPIDMMVEDLAADIADLHARVRKHERKPEDIEVSIFWAADDVEKLKRYRDLGVHRAIMGVPALSESETLKLLDHYASDKSNNLFVLDGNKHSSLIRLRLDELGGFVN
jgi:alkanesulfonate monooxygenase SsuD/methylene tetrahydromethanopterin reductase-like flavin-dependent oxidoreductase (luciferase family)